MSRRPIGEVAMTVAERSRRKRAKAKAQRDGVDFVPKMAQNSEVSASKARRGPGRPFSQGVSGNPGGRPRAALDVQALARQHTPKAIETLVKALDDGRLCVSAAVHLLDRAWGKPAATLELDGTTDRVTSVVLNIVSARDQPANGVDAHAPRVVTITGDE